MANEQTSHSPSPISSDPDAPAASWTATIEAAVQWNHTGIRLDAGRTYDFTAVGRWFDAQYEAGPDGYASPNTIMWLLEFRRRQRQARWFTLIGAIDEDPASQFVIGSAASFTPARSGELTCFANDWMSRYGNNCGSVTLTVRGR